MPPSWRRRLAVGCGCLGGLAALSIVAAMLVAAVPVGLRGWAAVRESEDPEQAAPSSGRFVDADGLRIYVQTHGPTDGPAVLLIHGSGAWSGTWRDTQAALADRGFHVVALDLPPFGFSHRPSDARYDRPAQARRILAVADALSLERFALVGHSFGGGPTVEAALLGSHRVWALVLADAALSLDSRGADPGLAGAVSQRPWMREIGVAATFTNPMLTRSAVVAMIHDPSDASPDRIALYQAPLVVRGTTPAIGAWMPELVAPDPRARSLAPAALRSLAVPALLVWGLEDTVTPPSQAEHLDRLLPRSEVAWLEEVGHIPHIEDVGAFHGAVLPFLERHARP